MVEKPAKRDDIHPNILTSLVGSGAYMPPCMFPKKACELCLYRGAEWRDDGYCYMFREQPTGDRCRQFISIMRADK